MPANNDSAALPGGATLLQVPHEDRSEGLTIFGILTILLGCLCGLFVPLMLFGQAMSARAGTAPMPLSSLLPGLLMYGSLAVALVWLGIGSIMARRWARALLLIFSWSWLIFGLFMVVVMTLVVPRVLANASANGQAGQPGMPSGAGAVIGIGVSVAGFVSLFLPAIWTYFYGSRHVKATCEARDSVTRWTDRCPLPVLALCLWLLSAVPIFLLMPLSARCVIPFFGMFLTGFPAAIICLAMAAIWSLAAWWLYKLDQRGWWLILVAWCVGLVSTLITFTQHDMLEIYRLMHYPEAQIEQMQRTGLTSGFMNLMMSFGMLLYVGYLMYIKKFFPQKS
jgi:hypothetical protein